jgi:hypothetical protein
MVTLPSLWFLAPARLCISTTATNLDVSSKEGVVIGSAQHVKIPSGSSLISDMNNSCNCQINEISIKLKQ